MLSFMKSWKKDYKGQKLAENDVKNILKLYKAGHTMNALAEKYKVSKTTVRYHLSRFEVPIRKMTDYFKKVG